jgi:hypothetical protein
VSGSGLRLAVMPDADPCAKTRTLLSKARADDLIRAAQGRRKDRKKP